MDTNNYIGSSMKCKKFSKYSSRVKNYYSNSYEKIFLNHNNDYELKNQMISNHSKKVE